MGLASDLFFKCLGSAGDDAKVKFSRCTRDIIAALACHFMAEGGKSPYTKIPGDDLKSEAFSHGLCVVDAPKVLTSMRNDAPDQSSLMILQTPLMLQRVSSLVR